jgi:predicted AlkP superfamily phosphohydrolase/phosphomutase
MSRTVLIGLDGATFTVLDALFQAGEMPFLQQFMQRGAHAELASTVHPLTPAAWTSMITGRTPGNHGIFDFIRCSQTRDGVFFTLNMSYDIQCPTLWSILSQRGMRVASLNFPVSYPPEPVNGVCIPGFMHWRHLRQSVYPPEFYEKMRALPGFDAKFLSMDTSQEFQSIQYLPDEEYESWIMHHIQREERWFDLIKLILTEDAPDLTAFIFDGVDKLQHLCWRFLDPALHPSMPTLWEARILDLCLTYFRQLDGFIRQIVAAAGAEARIFVASDHGFGPTESVFFANTWLAEKGYLVWKNQTRKDSNLTSANIADEGIKFYVEAIDWDRTSAFALNPSSNGIYIRRADGVGSPGISAEKYEDFRAQLVEKLLAVEDPGTGECFFSQVLTREQAFPGDFSARAPDITLLMKDNGFLSVIDSDAVFRRRPQPWGTHYPQGIFAAAGPGIKPLGRMSGMRIVDVAPVLLRSVGFAPPVDMEGVCPRDLFDDSQVPVEEHRELAAASYGIGKSPDSELQVEVQAEVLKRLRAIGYLAPEL